MFDFLFMIKQKKKQQKKIVDRKESLRSLSKSE